MRFVAWKAEILVPILKDISVQTTEKIPWRKVNSVLPHHSIYVNWAMKFFIFPILFIHIPTMPVLNIVQG